MRVCLAQIDVRLGDLEANVRRVREAIAGAQRLDADLVVFPELALTGYALGSVEHDTAIAPADLPAIVGDASAVLGFRERDGDRTFNSAAYLQGGSLVHVHRKLYLPHYDVFVEASLFAQGDTMRAFDTELGRMAVLICNDAWQPFVPAIAAQDGARVLIMPANSSTVLEENEAYWRGLTQFYARMLECYVVFVNRVGDEAGFTFWGGSHVVAPRGQLVVEAPVHEEALVVAEIDLERVEQRRRERPIIGQMRPDLLRAELARLLGGE